MIGSGQHIRVQMWHGDKVVADGVLYPGCDFAATFKDGPQLVSMWALTRITKEEAEQLEAEVGTSQEFFV